MPQLPSPEVLDGRAVAELLHLPHSTVLEFARRGVIPAHKLGRRWLSLRDEVDAAVRAAPAIPVSRIDECATAATSNGERPGIAAAAPARRSFAANGEFVSFGLRLGAEHGTGRAGAAIPASVSSPTAQRVADKTLRASAVSVPLPSARATPAA